MRLPEVCTADSGHWNPALKRLVPLRRLALLARACLALLFACLAGQAGAAAGADQPALFASGRPTALALEAVGLLLAAGQDGLDPGDYQAQALAGLLRQAQQGPPLEAGAEARLAAVLDEAMASLVADMHGGRIDPRAIHASFGIKGATIDARAYWRAAASRQRLAESLHALRPDLPMYASLLRALADYRALQDHPAMRLPLPPPGRLLEPGQPYAGVQALAARLLAMGDLPPGLQAGPVYDEALAQGVKAFQARHGLLVDGIIGSSTLAQLNTPPAARIRQIGLALERLRWTPLLASGRMIVINVPEFVLYAYDSERPDRRLSMDVIVGRAVDTRTPLFIDELHAIEFSPYWNIPASIARSETVPMLLRDPGRFEQDGLEFVSPGGVAIREFSRDGLEAVLRGSLRLRQRPGPANALGGIKFVLRNSAGIYLHHTPAVQLFARSRRDFSHGCIRLQDPLALALWALDGQPGWTLERMREAMRRDRPLTVRVGHPVPVLIAYGTALVKPGGKVHFLNDVYGNDALLDAALAARQQARRDSLKALGLWLR